jgi:hypothetical protein
LSRISYDINWEKYLLTDVLEKNYMQKEFGVYFISLEPFLRRKEILYIGKIVNQTFPERIRQNYQTFNESLLKRIRNARVFVSLGLMKNVNPDEKIVSEVENLLIFMKKPVHNNQLKNKYHGREIAIKNGGAYSPLLKIYSSP